MDKVKAFKKQGNFYFVTQESAILSPGTGNDHGMTRDHKGLVYFPSKDDSDYILVLGHIRPLVSGAIEKFRLRQKAQVLDEDKVRLIKKVLSSGVNMDMELATLSKVSATGSWITERQEFAEWRNSSSLTSCLWIEGPLGYGKTAMSAATTNFLAEAIRTEKQCASHRQQKTLHACFFCDEKPCCSTAEDLLKSVLLQLIDLCPKLATHAEDFLGQGHHVNATLTIENLWRCLKAMLEDVSLHTVYIIVNNFHRLDQNESLQKLLQWMELDFSSADPSGSSRSSCHLRWFLTAFSKFRDDISTSLASTGTGSNVRKIDLENSQNANDVKKALIDYVQGKAGGLKVDKGYDHSLAFEVEEILESKAENRDWVDVACLQLGTLPPNCSRLLIRDRLEAAARKNLKKLVKDSWEWIFAQMHPDTKTVVQDVLRALVLLVTDVTLEECSILTGYTTTDLEPLINKCAPMLTIEGDYRQVKFANNVVRRHLLSNWASLLVSPGSDPSLEEATQQKTLQHGYLAWRCFSYVDNICASAPASIANAQRIETTPEAGAPGAVYPLRATQDGGNKLHSTLLSSKVGMYPVRSWREHVIGGREPVAQSLCTGLPQFWGSDGPVRTKWLRDYTKMPSEFDGLSTIESMSALHVVSALGLRDLANVLLKDRREGDVNALDGNFYTPLHLAAFNNHVDIVKLLMNHGADISISSTIASPLHLAAVRGHVSIMELLLTSRRENLSNVNARSEKYGPVINAAILSGVVRGVELLLGRTELSLDLDSDMESPLALAARVSEPKIFHDILRAGQKTWTREHYEQALEMASRNGRVECVNAIISSSQPLSPNRIEASLLIAGLKDHWEVVDRLLDLAPRISYSNIFFLTATTLSKQSHDHLLERTWDLALSDIPKRVRDAALYRATDNEKKPTVEWLLTKCGADPNATADKPPELAVECVNKFPLVSYGDALTAAAHDGNLDLIRVLLSHGAVVDSEHGAALQTAARQGHLAAVDLLLDKEADIDRIINLDLMEELGMEWKSGTALQAACDYRKDHIVRHLLARKANPNRSCAHSTYTYPVISAAANNQPDILKYLLDVEKTEVKVCEAKDGLSPLHLACERMDLSSVKRLLDRGADINAEDFKGNQALHMAAFKGDSKVVSFLLQHSARTSHNSKDKGLALQEALNNRHIICATLLADATVPIFDSLTSAANTGNGFAESVITNPTGEHPRLDTNKIANLEGDIQRLQKRNEEVENILKKYNYMEKLVGESKLIADEKIEDAEKARAELLDTHKRFDISIAGFDSVRAQCNKLEAETHDLRQENRSQQERLLQHTRHIERTTFEFQSCKTTLQSTENLLEIERQRVQALRAEIEQLRTDTVPRGSVFSTNSSEAFDQSTHGRQSSVSTDRLDAVSPADSDHPASGKGHRSGLARMHKYTKNSLSSVSDVWKKN